MYEALDLVQWQTCVVCWRAWYDVPRSYHFRPQAGAYSGSRAWFNFHSSSVLGATRRKDVDHWFLQRDDRAGSHVDAAAFLKNNYDEATCQRLLDRLVDVHLKRHCHLQHLRAPRGGPSPLRTTGDPAVRLRCGSFVHAGSRPGFASCRRAMAGAHPRR